MRGQSRRQIIQSGLGLAGAGLLAGCGLAPVSRLWRRGPHRIGYLSVATPSSAEENYAAFRAGLAELGYVEGEDIVFEVRYSDGRQDALPALASELAALHADVIVTDGGNRAFAATRQASTTIPVVFTIANDPVADGIVASASRPGGSLTGLTVLAEQEDAKRLQLLRDVSPNMQRVAVIWPSAQVVRFQPVQNAAPALGLQIVSVNLDGPDDLGPALTSAIAGQADGLILFGAAGGLAPMIPRIVEFAAQNRWPSMFATPSVARVGGLLAYGPNIPDLFRRAAGYVDKILRGANPGELPIERPAKFEFVVNLKTARAIGLTVPQSILEQATEVIQ